MCMTMTVLLSQICYFRGAESGPQRITTFQVMEQLECNARNGITSELPKPNPRLDGGGVCQSTFQPNIEYDLAC